MKYALTDTTKDGLYQIVELKDFANVSKGGLGGFISSIGNLSQDGDARVYEDAMVLTTPAVILGLYYPITITETHIFIGCQSHTKEAWADFTDSQIAKMGGKNATSFWSAHKKTILKLAGVY